MRFGLLFSVATAAVALALATVRPSHDDTLRRIAVGASILLGNMVAYRFRDALFDRADKRGPEGGIVGVAISLIGGALLFACGGADNPFFPAVLIGAGLTAFTGRPGWALVAAASLSATYLLGRELNGQIVDAPFVIINAAAPFWLAAVVGAMQFWFARYAGTGHLPARLAELIGPIEGDLVPDARLDVIQRVARLDDDQLRIYRLLAANRKLKQIGPELGWSTSSLRRKRNEALLKTGAHADPELVSWVVYVEGLPEYEGSV